MVHKPIFQEIDRAIDYFCNVVDRRRRESPDQREAPGGVLVDVDFQGPWRATQFDYSIRDYYSNPLLRFLIDIKYGAWRFENLPEICIKGTNGLPEYYYLFDDYVMRICRSFGMDVKIYDDVPPWAGSPAIHDPKDLYRMKLPDFYQGFSAEEMALYDDLKKLSGERIKVVTAPLNASPFDLACVLRGQTNLLEDIILQPDFVREVLDFCCESRLLWDRQWREFVREEVPVVYGLSNDSVDCNIISPLTYRDLISPFDAKIAKEYPAIFWHSCGNITPILQIIRDTFPNLKRIDVSAWSNLSKAKEVFAGSSVIVRKEAHPIEDVLSDDDEHRLSLVDEIVEATESVRILFRIDGLQQGHRLEHVVRLVEMLKKGLTKRYS